MSQTERWYKIRHWFQAGRCLTPDELQRELEVSLVTLKRDIQHLRHRMNMPVAWSKDRGGWFLDRREAVIGPQYELPGL